MSLAKTTGVVFAVQVVSVLLQALGLVYFVRELGSYLFGVFVLFQAVLLMCSFLADLGIDGALEKRISEGYGGHIIGSAIALKSGVLVVLSVGIVLFSQLINSYFGEQLALLLIPVLIVNQAGQIIRKTLHGELRVDDAAILRLLRRGLFVVVGVSLVFLGAGVTGLVASLFGSWCVFCVAGAYMIDTSPAWPTATSARSLLAFSKYNVIVSVVSGYMYEWVDTLLIGLFLAQSHVAAYEIAWRVTGIVMLLSSSIGQTIFPQISDWDAADQREKIVEMIPDAITGTLIAVVPALVGTALFGAEILRHVFGSEFVIATTALLILMVSKIPEGVNVVLGRVILGIDRPDLAAVAVAVFIVLNIVLNVILIQAVGITGAAAATAVSFGVNAGLTAYYLSQLIEIRVHWQDLGVIGFASVGMGTVLYLTQRVVPVTSLPVVVAMVGFGALLYVALLLLSADFRQKFRTTARAVLL